MEFKQRDIRRAGEMLDVGNILVCKFVVRICKFLGICCQLASPLSSLTTSCLRTLGGNSNAAKPPYHQRHPLFSSSLLYYNSPLYLTLCYTLLIAISHCLAGVAHAQLIDNMDGPSLALKFTPNSSGAQLLEHAKETVRFHFGHHAERALLIAPASHSNTLIYSIPKAPVIQELHVNFWLMSDIPEVRLAARVTLPRTINPATSSPYQITVKGTQTTQAGVWQQVSLGDLPKQLERQTRIARLQHKDPLDERGAYINELLLLIPGHNRPVEILVDRVEVSGMIERAKSRSVRDTPALASTMKSSTPATKDSPASFVDSQVRTTLAVQPSLRHKPPRVPRIIQWQGEPFEYLARLQFDAVAIGRPATSQEMSEAGRLGIFLICPPPLPQEIHSGKITEAYSSILAWDLGSLETPDDIQRASQRKDLLIRHDPQIDRLTVLRPGRYVQEASRIADVLLIGRRSTEPKLSLADYAKWLEGRKRLARPGTPIWLQLDCQPNESPVSIPPTSSLTAHSTGKKLPAIENQLALATTINTRGIYCTSPTSLILKDRTTQIRALSLELINLQIGLIEPWLASGKLVSPAKSNRSQLTAAVLKVERSFLLVPIRWNPSKEEYRNKHTGREEQTTFLVPGVPESCEVYSITPTGAFTLRHRRVTGGIRIYLDSQVPNGFVLFTEDGQVFSQVARFIQRHSFRTVKLTRDLATLRLQEAIPNAKALAMPSSQAIQPLLNSAQSLITQCDALLAQGKIEVAYQRTVAANHLLDKIEAVSSHPANHAVYPTTATPNLSTAITQSASHSREGLPLSLRPTTPYASMRENGSTLLKTSFENLDNLQQSGWLHKRLPTEEIVTLVQLSPEEPYEGNYCLELAAQSSTSVTPIIATAPVWVSSAPIQLHPGEQVEIRGMVRVPQRLTGSIDGLQIFDSLGGMRLALRIQQTNNWEPFRITRVAPADTTFTVTFALTGLGKAQIDDVSIRQVSTGDLNTARLPVQNGPGL